MPTYEYECQACGEIHEIFHGMNDKGPSKCPSCGKRGLKKLIGAGAGILFKGPGFYTTDYRSKEYKDKAKKEKAEGQAPSKDRPALTGVGDSGGESKSESKSGTGSQSGSKVEAEGKAKADGASKGGESK